ncbi:MAG TPA: DUF4956 domain-containing protein [Bacteroidales bacterium]|nr:DUF4956 domain-containing protein [Bacteroidales bacterium]HSA43717.1 DUF4956 domain-containing protein [Bacteroidales bacterium]
MKTIKLCLFLLLFAALATPGVPVRAQETETGLISLAQEDAAESKDDKKDKKSDKKKDVVEVNQAFFVYLLIDLVSFMLIILFVFRRNGGHHENIFTYLMFNVMIFMLTFLLNKIKISVGAAFGLFAVFSMLRYRTESVSMKELTYLFIFIGIGLISAIELEYHELIIINAVIFLLTFIYDSNIFFRREHSRLIYYDNTENITPDKMEILLEDIRKRTGLPVHRVKISRVNYMRDAAEIMVYYYETRKTETE